MGKEMTFANYNSSLEKNIRKIDEMKILDFRKKVKEIKAKAQKQNEEVVAEANAQKAVARQNTARFVRDVAVTVVGAILVAKLTGFSDFYNNIKDISKLATKEDLADMVTKSDIGNMVTKEDIKDMATASDIDNMATQTDIEGLRTEIVGIKGELKSEIAYVRGRLGIAIEPNEYLENSVNKFYDEAYSETEDYVWINLKQEAGRDLTTGNICTAEDLINETVVLSYVDENSDEVFVKCSFNEDNQWDGKCIINKYSDGNLKSIVNAEYESGELAAYHQVFSYINASGTEVWAISSRTVEEKGNAGQTWTFFKEKKEWKKSFEKEYLKAENIIDEEYFYDIMDLDIEGYYNGYTSDGYFNDENENGTAYMIKYNEEGYVRLFYTGQFVNGKPCNPEGTAVVISLGYDGENYYYYSGEIEDISDIGEDWRKISVEEVKQIVKNINYEGPLRWYGEVI